MKNFVWGALVGAAITWLALNGTTPIYEAVVALWEDVSRPPPALEP